MTSVVSTDFVISYFSNTWLFFNLWCYFTPLLWSNS